MQMRIIPYSNSIVLAIMDDGGNVISSGAFKSREEMDEAIRMTSVLLKNLGLIDGVSTGALPMPYEEFRAMLTACRLSTDERKGREQN